MRFNAEIKNVRDRLKGEHLGNIGLANLLCSFANLLALSFAQLLSLYGDY
jgi:hypothetical protein